VPSFFFFFLAVPRLRTSPAAFSPFPLTVRLPFLHIRSPLMGVDLISLFFFVEAFFFPCRREAGFPSRLKIFSSLGHASPSRAHEDRDRPLFFVFLRNGRVFFRVAPPVPIVFPYFRLILFTRRLRGEPLQLLPTLFSRLFFSLRPGIRFFSYFFFLFFFLSFRKRAL